MYGRPCTSYGVLQLVFSQNRAKPVQFTASLCIRSAAMQVARQAFQQLARRSVHHAKGARGMASDASAEKAHLDEAMKEMSKWYAICPACVA